MTVILPLIALIGRFALALKPDRYRTRLFAGALLQRPIERVEHDRAGLEPSDVIPVLQGDARDEGGETARLLALEPLVAEIDVMNDVGDVAQRRVFATPAAEQDLERAHLAFVRELGVEHVEAELAGGRG